MDKLKCNYCGKVRDKVMFYIGASREKDWVMWEGTGAISCPECWEFAKHHSKEVIDKHINSIDRYVINKYMNGGERCIK